MALLYINNIPASIKAAFSQKVNEIAQYLAIDPNWLMQVMYSESRLNPQAVNSQKGDSSDPYTRAATRATGLIQFMPKTAKGLGTNNQALYKMNGLQQLDYVKKYYTPYKGRMKSYYDVYAATFFPAAMGKPDNWILQSTENAASAVAKQNPAINKNKDGVITVGEFKAYVKGTVSTTYQNVIFKAVEAIKSNPGISAGTVLAVAAFFF